MLVDLHVSQAEYCPTKWQGCVVHSRPVPLPAADISGQQTTIGIFNTADEAAQAYDAAAMSMYGLSASLNFPAQVSSLWGWMSHLMLALPGQAVKLLMLTVHSCPAMPCTGCQAADAGTATSAPAHAQADGH